MLLCRLETLATAGLQMIGTAAGADAASVLTAVHAERQERRYTARTCYIAFIGVLLRLIRTVRFLNSQPFMLLAAAVTIL